MIEDDDFNDYESAGDQHRHNFTENIAENRAETTMQMGLLDSNQYTIKQPFLQRFFSLGSLPATSSPVNFDELLKDKSIDAYSTKKDNTIDAVQPTNFINFTRHGSESYPNNVSNLTYEFNSFTIEPEIAKSQLNMSLAERQIRVNYQFQAEKQQTNTISNYAFQGIPQNIGMVQNNVALAQKKEDGIQINFQNVVSNPKHDYVSLVEASNINIQVDPFINFDLSANNPNQFIPAPQINLQNYNKNQTNILSLQTEVAYNLEAEAIKGKERKDSDEFEFVQAQKGDGVHIQTGTTKAENIQEQDVWPDFMNKSIQPVQYSSIFTSNKEPPQTILNEFSQHKAQVDYGFLQTNQVQTKANAATLQTQYDQDQFVFGQHTHHKQQSQLQQQKPLQNQAQLLQQQNDEEFGDFSQTNSQQFSQQVPYQHNFLNSSNQVALIAQSGFGSLSASKQKQLQSFLDSLPDYSQVFAEAQLC